MRSSRRRGTRRNGSSANPYGIAVFYVYIRVIECDIDIGKPCCDNDLSGSSTCEQIMPVFIDGQRSGCCRITIINVIDYGTDINFNGRTGRTRCT